MSERKFKFVSPGIFINEIDNSQLPSLPLRVGPVVIGRTERGPGMRPIRIQSMSDFVNIFGNPIPGGRGGDVWRYGNYTSPTYASYAAQAYLKNNGPVVVVRLMGENHPDANSTTGTPGWTTNNKYPATARGSSGGAFGLFIFPSSSANTTAATYVTGTLAAVWYMDSGSIELSGALYNDDGSTAVYTTGSNKLIKGTGGTSYEFKAIVKDGSSDSGAETLVTTFNFDDSSNKFIRKAFNTNPTLTDSISDSREVPEQYWLGETYEDWLNEHFEQIGLHGETAGSKGTTTGEYYGTILALVTGSSGSQKAYADFKESTKLAKTPWIFSQDLSTNSGSYNPTGSDGAATADGSVGGVQKLFRLVTLNSGEWEAQNLKVSIQDIKKSTNLNDPYGSFTVTVRKRADTDNAVAYVERFSGCNLNPGSPDFVARKVGDMKLDWDNNQRRYRLKGDYPNMSRYIRIDMRNEVAVGETDERLLPFGFYGPPRYKSQQITFDIDTEATASATDALKITGGTVDHNDAFTVLVPVAAGGADPVVTAEVLARTSMESTPSESQIHWYLDPASDAAKIANLKLVFDGTTDETKVKFGSKFTNTVGIKGLSSATGVTTTDSYMSVTADNGGTAGNSIVITDTEGGVLVNSSPVTLSGGDSTANITINDSATMMISGGAGMPDGADPFIETGVLGHGSNYLANIEFPRMRLRNDSFEGNLSDPTRAFFGIQTNKRSSTRQEAQYVDLVRPKAQFLDSWDYDRTTGNEYLEFPFYFSLDDLCFTGSCVTNGDCTSATTGIVPHAKWIMGARKNQSGPAAEGGSGAASTTLPCMTVKSAIGAGSWETVLDKGYDQFTLPLVGGSDGVDIKKMDPFGDVWMQANSSETDSYVFNTYKRAIDAVADPEVVESNLITVPGLKNKNLQQHIIKVCEERADTLAILDPPFGYKPPAETDGGLVSETGVMDVVNEMTTRGYDSSYACMYYPWVQIRDTISNNVVWVPPSVPMLGVMGSTETFHELWFAPAGFNRGGLSAGAAGLPVISVRERLATKDRDKLYEARVNPIASFPAEGIVAFGQKTLQVTPSALDRVNVRRLMNHIKKQVSRMAATILFDQNVRATWNRFLNRVEPFLTNIKARFGLGAFRVILDETTTTPDLIDRNIMYAKIFLKPAKAIEFIAIDFVITNQGASFED